MKRYMFAGILGLLLSISCAFAADITIVTEDWGPFNYIKDGKVTGLSTEIILAAVKDAGLTAEIKVLPWSRAYDMALKNKNVFIYTIVRTSEREKLFKWVGELMKDENYFFKLKDRKDIKLAKLEDAKVFKIGAVKDDVREQYLTGKKFKKLDIVSNDENNMNKLFLGRIDLMADNEFAMSFRAKQLGLDFSRLEKTILIPELSEPLCFAASIATPDDIVKKLIASLEKVKKGKEFAKIKAKYLN
ncbi:MAG: hypothetical protein A2X42_09460 [Candidatus Margulisbacteria bacterium GWF2_38_17]|nr:MAG: hypothetical protein A2X43_05010 [Candidatus Margulisbacteria bacterium GWD2_39_127]OGI02371.1 MAG: hypothetical protein A2X42_09460 [Candidatus Margulisbacteria bacterium GWF2_38_17]OGI08504.1 MAG: hypothetical protein A2X41_07250 [Candidatus Margulisbacteria bacterium GWE2_39_32]